jgi:hypothetical protein
MTWEEWERDKALTCDMEVSNEPEFVERWLVGLMVSPSAAGIGGP